MDAKVAEEIDTALTFMSASDVKRRKEARMAAKDVTSLSFFDGAEFCPGLGDHGVKGLFSAVLDNGAARDLLYRVTPKDVNGAFDLKTIVCSHHEAKHPVQATLVRVRSIPKDRLPKGIQRRHVVAEVTIANVTQDARYTIRRDYVGWGGDDGSLHCGLELVGIDSGTLFSGEMFNVDLFDARERAIRERAEAADTGPLVTMLWTLWYGRWEYLGGSHYAPDAFDQKAKEALALHHASLACSAEFSRRYQWRVVLGYEGNPAVSFITDPIGAREAFRLRDVPAGAGRRAALRNWVTEHWRKRRAEPEEERKVRAHLRGATEFTWNGLRCKIQPSTFDLQQAVPS